MQYKRSGSYGLPIALLCCFNVSIGMGMGQEPEKKEVVEEKKSIEKNIVEENRVVVQQKQEIKKQNVQLSKIDKKKKPIFDKVTRIKSVVTVDDDSVKLQSLRKAVGLIEQKLYSMHAEFEAHKQNYVNDLGEQGEVWSNHVEELEKIKKNIIALNNLLSVCSAQLKQQLAEQKLLSNVQENLLKKENELENQHILLKEQLASTEKKFVSKEELKKSEINQKITWRQDSGYRYGLMLENPDDASIMIQLLKKICHEKQQLEFLVEKIDQIDAWEKNRAHVHEYKKAVKQVAAISDINFNEYKKKWVMARLVYRLVSYFSTFLYADEALNNAIVHKREMWAKLDRVTKLGLMMPIIPRIVGYSYATKNRRKPLELLADNVMCCAKLSGDDYKKELVNYVLT